MRSNTPPPPRGIDRDDDEYFQEDEEEMEPYDDDMEEMDEVSFAELEARLAEEHDGFEHTAGYGSDHSDDAEGAVGGLDYSSVPDLAELTFRGHSGPVFSCALHPKRNLAATGGEDDRVFVWHTQSGEVLYKFDEHKDTVTEVHWNHDGSYLVTGDMAGELKVHKLQEKEGDNAADDSAITFSKVWEFSMGDMTWLCWHRSGNVLFSGSDSGEIYMWTIPKGRCIVVPGKGSRCETATLNSDGKKLFAGYANGVFKLWDLKTSTVLMEVDENHPLMHEKGVVAVAADMKNPLYMSGGTEGKIIFSSNNGPVSSADANGPVECIAFSPSTEIRLAASGTLNGHIHIWDVAKGTLRTQCEHPQEDGITKLKWLSDYMLLVATVSGFIHAFDVRTGALEFSLTGHQGDIYNFDYDPRERNLLSVSEDKLAKIFKIPPLDD